MNQVLKNKKNIAHELVSSDVFLDVAKEEHEPYNRNSNMNHFPSSKDDLFEGSRSETQGKEKLEKAKEKISKLTIRVQVSKKSSDKPVLKHGGEIPEVAIYNIPRILGVVCVLILLILSVVYFIFQNKDHAVNVTALAPDERVEIVVKPAIDKAQEPSITTPVAKPIDKPIEKLKLDKDVEPVVENDIASLDVSDTPEKIIDRIEPPKKQVVDVASTNKAVTDVISSTAGVSEGGLSTKVVLLSEQAIPAVASQTKSVSRTQFSFGIEHREPVDVIDHVVQVALDDVNTNGLTKVFFFSELTGLKGQSIRHQWFYQDRLQTTLTFNVGGNRWRVNSSKRLSPFKVGIWRVNVINEQGVVLATKAFDYRLL